MYNTYELLSQVATATEKFSDFTPIQVLVIVLFGFCMFFAGCAERKHSKTDHIVAPIKSVLNEGNESATALKHAMKEVLRRAENEDI